MKFTSKASILAAVIIPAIAQAKNWAQFCTDLDGKDNCSISYDLNNPGCFATRSDVKSVKFHRDAFSLNSDYSLIYSTKPGCNCQVAKQTVSFGNGVTPGVLRLDTSKPHASFRWISGKGDKNNC